MSMVRTETQVPSNYYTRSRDFQLLGRIFDLSMNSSKDFADSVLGCADGSALDGRMLPLLAKTVGFDCRDGHAASDLLMACRGFKSILRRKGSEQAIVDCVSLLMRSQNVDSTFDVTIINKRSETGADGKDVSVPVYEVRVMVPKELNDIALLEDLLDYVLPAGYVLNIIVGMTDGGRLGEVDVKVSAGKQVERYADDMLGKVYGDNNDAADSTTTILSTVYDPNSMTGD